MSRSMQERSVAGYPSIIERQPQTINLDLRQFHQRRANYPLSLRPKITRAIVRFFEYDIVAFTL